MSALGITATDEPLSEEPWVAPAEKDIDPDTWLNQDDTRVTGSVEVTGGTLQVAALTQGELTKIRKLSRKINPRDPKGEPIVDPDTFNRHIIAFGLAKAAGKAGPGQVGTSPEELRWMPLLEQKLTGDLTVIVKRILKLSGFEQGDERSDPLDENFD